MAKHPITTELLRRYLEGNLDEEEVEAVEEWYASLQNPETVDIPAFNNEIHLKKVQHQIVALENETGEKVLPLKRTSVWWRYAAAAMLLLAVFAGYHLLRFPADTTDVRQVSGAMVINNSSKQIMRYMLPDSSVVWLNPNAELTYTATDFTSEMRQVGIAGEAFFEVKRDVTRPFLVEVDKMNIKVLGTSFHVYATPGKTQYEVAVISGKVEVSSAERNDTEKNNVILLPEEKAVFEVASGVLTASKLPEKSDHAVTWRNVSLTFDDIGLDEVVQRLEAKFGVKIELTNQALANCKLKAAFENQKLVEILETASEMLEMEYEIDADTIRLDGNGCIL